MRLLSLFLLASAVTSVACGGRSDLDGIGGALANVGSTTLTGGTSALGGATSIDTTANPRRTVTSISAGFYV